MSHQLLPEGFHGVMEPITAQITALKPDDYWYEVKWDGVRLVIIIDREEVTVINRHGRNKTIQFPELQKLPEYLNCRTAVIDGEGVVIQNNRPGFAAVIKRNNRQTEPPAQLLSELPLTYMMFDLLAINDKSLLNWRYEDRKQKLHEILSPYEQFQEVDKIASGIDLWTAVQTLNLEGIVAKKKGSIYQAGKHHHSWFKIKHRRQEWCVIGGYTLQGSNINALLLGKPSGRQLRYVGRVGLSKEYANNEAFLSSLRQMVKKSNPFDDVALIKTGSNFIIPLLGALVEYAEWTPELRLRHPVLKTIMPLSMLSAQEVNYNA
ncbi:MAG: hypothetical protein ACM3NT_00880 [Methylocystaceae bacterium]